MTRPSWLARAARNRHCHAIEPASRRWRGGRRDDSARTRRKILISTQVNIPSIQKIMVNFQVENERAEMTQEVMGDMLDDAMAEDGDSDEEEKIVGAVLDEIGISFGDTIPDAPDAMACLLYTSPSPRD